jgi:hypothetical protein
VKTQVAAMTTLDLTGFAQCSAATATNAICEAVNVLPPGIASTCFGQPLPGWFLVADGLLRMPAPSTPVADIFHCTVLGDGSIPCAPDGSGCLANSCSVDAFPATHR